MSEELKFLIDVVKNASLLITDKFTIKAKGSNGDLVTDFDYEIEKYISKTIQKKYPDFVIVSEEYNSEKELTDNCFVIDPIDGTINFAHNIPLWAIQVACIKNRETCAAVIYVPKLDEMYYADKYGAFLNGSKIKVNSLDTSKGLYTIEGQNRVPGQVKMRKNNPHCRDFNCSAINYAWVACGRISATILRNNSYWDYIPGEYLVKQAGGVIYNQNNAHIAANSEEFLQEMKKNAVYDDEKVEIINKL